MNKKEFINEIKTRLSILKKEEIDDIVNEYSEYIDEKIKSGKSESEAIKEFGDIDELVGGILDAYKINSEYYNNNSVLDKVFDDTKNVFDKVIKIISNGTSKEILKLLVYIGITILICYILKLPFYIIESFINKIIIGFPVSIYNVISRFISIIIYTIYIIFVFIVFIKIMNEKIINNFDIKEKTKKTNSKSKVKESVNKKDIIKDKNNNINNNNSNNRTILDGILDIFKFMFKLFAGFILFASSICLIVFSALFVISVFIFIKYNFSIGLSISFLGLIIGSIWIIYILYKYIVNSKISFSKVFIMFCLSIILCGVGIGVFSFEFTNFEYIDSHHEFILKQEKEYNINDINYIECPNCENIKSVKDNNMKDDEYLVKIYTTTYNEPIYQNYYNKSIYFSVTYKGSDIYKVVLDDISDKKLYDYDLYNSLDIEVIGNSNTLNKLYIKE